MKKIALLGSTGSIGTQSLDIIRRHPEELRIVSLAAYASTDLLEEQAREFMPEQVCLYNESAAADLKLRLRDLPIKVLSGMEGLLTLASDPQADFACNAVSGMIGIRPTIAAIESKKTVALANKETLVTAGHLIMPLAKKYGVRILPVDSEHSAIFQCLNGENPARIRKILLTCSGGIFRGKKAEELRFMTAKEALRNPNWVMGRKVTIDTATLVNKGLEVMEASHLFDVPVSQIEVLLHAGSLCHSGVEFVDGAQILQTATPDMRLPIQYAFFYPDRVEGPVASLDLFQAHALTFEKPDTETFRGLPLAFHAAEAGGTMPTVFNAADEEAVAAFLAGKIYFPAICELIAAAMDAHRVIQSPSLPEILDTEAEARAFIRSAVS